MVLAHTFASGGISSDSERDLSIGGVGAVPLDLFDGFGYTALGHLHGRQELSPAVRYSGSPLAYSFSEARHKKGSWLVDVDAAGVGGVREVLWEAPRTLAVLRGKLEELLLAEEHAWAESAYCQITLTDAQRPAQAMERLRSRFPDTLVLGFRPGRCRRRRQNQLQQQARRGRGRPVRLLRFPGARPWPGRRRRRGGGPRRSPGIRAPGRNFAVRIHRLEISAFGPFAATEHIDFDRLSAHGLFLLNGPTGAGKTSVLDAICFALYGSVPGARQDGKRLRSDHAEAAAEPRVTCEFSARGRHFEVSRSPAWDKPSARGSNGFTVQQANTLLRERVDGEWIEKSGRNDEAGAEIADVLGMNRDQFTRVVMLPQGDFAAFLRSKAADRLELLQSLFGTQRFEAVEQELGRKAQAARTEVASLNDQLELLLAQAEAETATLELDTADAPDRADPDSFLSWLEEQAGTVAEQRRAAALEAEGLRAVRLSARDTATARAARQAKLAAAERRRTEAEAAAPAVAARSGQLGLHRQAEVLGGQLQAVDSAGTAEDLAAAAMAAAAEELRTAALTDPELAALRNGTGAASRTRSPGTPSAAPAALTAPPTTARPCAPRCGDCVHCVRCWTSGCLTKPGSPDSGAAPPSCACSLAQLEEGRTSGAAALAALRQESDALLAGLRPLEELAAEVQLRTKEAAAAEELLVLVRRYAAGREGLRSRCGTPRPRPGGVPGPPPALARSPRGTAGQRCRGTRVPAAARRPVRRVRQPRTPGPRPGRGVRPDRGRGRGNRAAGLRGGGSRARGART